MEAVVAHPHEEGADAVAKAEQSEHCAVNRAESAEAEIAADEKCHEVDLGGDAEAAEQGRDEHRRSSTASGAPPLARRAAHRRIAHEDGDRDEGENQNGDADPDIAGAPAVMLDHVSRILRDLCETP